MQLGIFLPLGSSFKDLKKTGQDKRFVDYYLKKYVQEFKKVYIFSYENENIKLPHNCILIANKRKSHRLIYSFLLPFLNWKIIKEIDVFRVMQMTGIIPAILVKLFFGKPFIFTYGYNYASFARLEQKKIRAILLSWLEKIAVKLSRGLIVTNKRIGVYLKKEYPALKMHYIPNGVDIKEFRTLNLEPRILGNKKVKILTVARLEKQKNLDSLIKAVALLKDKYKIKLLFIGQGSLKLQLTQLTKKSKVDLRIIDKVSHHLLVKFYQQADIFCLPSFLEGQPKSLLEAMSCGLPCLVGNYPGVGEFKNKKEVLLTGFKVKDISQNLELLIKDIRLRKKLGLNARKRIVKDFDIKRLLEKEMKFLKNV